MADIWRITIYGFVITSDPVYGNGSGVLVDLVYFVDEPVDPATILDLIRRDRGHQMVAQYFRDASGNRHRVQDRVTVENWTEHIKVGTERMSEQQAIAQPGEPYEEYTRYNPPPVY